MNTWYDESAIKKVWMVNESDSCPDPYVADIFGEEMQWDKTLKKYQKLYDKLGEALNRAKVLNGKYSVKQIRLFYSNQGSAL